MEFDELLFKVTELFYQLMKQHKENVLGKEGMENITMSQFYYIGAIHKLNNPTFSELADALQVTKASVTAVIEKLVKHKLLRKEQSVSDQRVYHIYLTEKGQRLVEAEKECHRVFAEQIKKALTEAELSELSKIFHKIVLRYNGQV
jgi:DNA-binding MarR family transcriptional regulator